MKLYIVFADNQAIISNDEGTLQHALSELHKVSTRFFLTLVGKAKPMAFCKRWPKDQK